MLFEAVVQLSCLAHSTSKNCKHFRGNSHALLCPNSAPWPLQIYIIHIYIYICVCGVCTVLFCSVLFSSVLFCSVLFSSVLFCSVRFCSVLFSSVLFCSCARRTRPRKCGGAFTQHSVLKRKQNAALHFCWSASTWQPSMASCSSCGPSPVSGEIWAFALSRTRTTSWATRDAP